MYGRPPQSYRSGRTGARSKLKFTHRFPFDPYSGELDYWRKRLKPRRTLHLEGRQKCLIYEQPLHPAFLRPWTCDDVLLVLRSLPVGLLEGLEAVYLTGGSRRQFQVARSRLFRYGTYCNRRIWLFALPSCQARPRWCTPPAPHLAAGYLRCGAAEITHHNQWFRHFDPKSLRCFYLSDVLVHEVGHHADHHGAERRSTRDAERFAEHFVRVHAPAVRELLRQQDERTLEIQPGCWP